MSVTEHEVALVRGKDHFFKVKLTDEVIERVPRSEVDQVGLNDKRPYNLTISFKDGGPWEFEVPGTNQLKSAAALVDVLGPKAAVE